jgi:trigger factor
MIKKLPKSQVEFEITVPWKDWESYLDQVAAEASQELKFPGFRPGKAPRNLVEQRVGKETILNNTAEKAVKKSYVDYIRKEKLEVIGQPQVEILELVEEKDLRYKATVSVIPEVKVLPKYKEEVKKINAQYKDKKPEVKEDDIDLELEKLANHRAKLVTVNREAKKNDSVEVDFTVSRQGVPIENGTSRNHPLILGRGVFIPGFEENLIGMNTGEEKTFELNFPDEYHQKDLAGKPAEFKVKMNLVQERQVPKVDDEFAKSLGKFENIADLKKNMREGMEHEEEHKLKDEKRSKLMEAVIASSEVDLPHILVHEEVHQMLHEFESQTQAMGMTVDQYLEKIGKKKEDLEHDWEPQAEKRVISALAITQIAKDENITANSAEVEAEMNKTLQYYKKVKDAEKNIDMERLYNYSKGVLENEKVLEFLEKL